MANGILKKCTDCRKEKNCCCDFHKIDFPILNEREKTFIIEKYKVKDEFFVAIKDNCFNMIANQGVCPFYKDKCSIYENRPNDCKLFPYDIKTIDNKYYLILYKLNCFDTIDMLEENIDDVVEAIKPYINTFADVELNKKMNLIDYQIIKEIII